MAHKTLLGGTAYTVAGGRDLIDGVSYTKKQGKTCIDGTERTIGFGVNKSVFANNEWSEIITACHSNTVPDTWAVGNSKMMTIGGVDYQIDIIGKQHATDTYRDISDDVNGTVAPLTFQLHGLLPTSMKYYNTLESNSGGWFKSDLRAYLQSTILQQMPQEVQAGIRTIHKTAMYSTDSGYTNTGADTLFLLSEYEIFGKLNNSSIASTSLKEGAQYEYYKTGGADRRKKYLAGNEGDDYGSPWWLRSLPKLTTYNQYVQSMAEDGSLYFGCVWYQRYVTFGFCF